ncbi:MAG: ABC transporter substrate-binding protein [Chloroflexi bacterium]|nr:ABC transporter substrate-binding protein [Chloroflexota bacterium]
MKRKIFWLAVTSVMVLSLIMAACGPATPAPTVPTAPTTPTTPVTPTTPTAPTAPTAPVAETPQKEAAAPEKPKYGGTLRIRADVDPTCCDSATNNIMSQGLVGNWVYEQLLNEDWLKGPAGTGEFDYRAFSSPVGMMGTTLAESVETPELGVWVLKIRQGVHWQTVNSEAGRLMGGRELTADDVLWSLKRMTYDPASAIQVLQPRVANAMTYEKTGPWEITIKTPVQPVTALWWVIQGGGHNVIQPRQVVEKYGNLNNWRNSVGTSPWMLADYTPGSVVVYERNPNYWGKDPVGPGKGQQLPYIDRIQRLIIPDMSTTLAALRTGKIDMLQNVPIEDALQMIKTARGIESSEFLPNTNESVAFNFDNPKLPWADVRVRQALTMAIDFEAIKNGLYRGKAEIDTLLLNRNFTGKGYKPLNTMPESVQALYRYNPERAKQLLKEAGYPDGFSATILTTPVTARVDELAIIKDYWSKVGVKLTIETKENATLTAMVTRSFNWEHMFYAASGAGSSSNHYTLFTYLGYIRGDRRLQFISRLDVPGREDPVIEAGFNRLNANVFRNWPEVYKAAEELRPYVLEQAVKIPFPQPFFNTLWWPWVKNTHAQGPDISVFLKYYWLDQDLKKSMGY